MLAEFWKQMRYDDGPPFVHPADRDLIEKVPAILETDFERFINSSDFGKTENRLLLGLLPNPYAGDLKRADIYILLLNPGFSVGDLYAEAVPKAHDATIRTLYQDLDGEEFPFVWLSPRFCWTGAYWWWERKLSDVAHAYAEHANATYYEALRELSGRIATIELIPYHSLSSPSGILHRLPSAEVARRYVNEVVIPKANAGNAIVIATRKVRQWGLLGGAPHDNIVIYDPKRDARSASMSRNSAGGRAILRRLGIGT